MQVAILCGGRGTRIQGEVANVPKPMVPIGGFPIVWHIMKIYSHFGHREFIPCLGYRSWDFKEYFMNYRAKMADVTVRLGDNSVETHAHQSEDEKDWVVHLAETGLEALTGARVKRIQKYITDDCFLLTYGDGLADIDIDALVKFHKSHGKIATLTAVRPPSRFGDLDISGGQITAFKEKLEVGQGAINGGYFVLNREVFDYLDDREDLTFEQEPLRDLAADGQLMAFEHEGFWLPMDTFREWNMLEKMWASGQAPWKRW